MVQARRDENREATLIGASALDGLTPILIYADPVTNRLYVDAADSTILTVSKYGLNHTADASATLTYIGKEDKDGAWLVVSVDSTSGTVMTYATIVNNALVSTYAAAWAARATLTYGTYSQAFSV